MLAPRSGVEQGHSAETQLLPFSLLDRKPGSLGKFSALLLTTTACFFSACQFVGSFRLVSSNLLRTCAVSVPVWQMKKPRLRLRG